jgi:hypothetical protein
MNIFAGNISLPWNLIQVPDLDYDIITLTEKSFFIMWGTETFNTVEELRADLEKSFWEISVFDISFDRDDGRVEILSEEYPEDGVYECVSFEGPNVDMQDIVERFSDSAELVSVRKAWISQSYGNDIIKADFLF